MLTAATLPRTMRHWLVIALLMVLPLQLSWAAASGYCRHETGAAAQHFGHHFHQHKASDGSHAAADLAKQVQGDPDCMSCHAGCLSALTVELPMELGVEQPVQLLDPPDAFSSWPADPLERPQWRRLA